MSPKDRHDPRVKRLSDRLQRMVDEEHPLVDLVLKWLPSMLDEWAQPGGAALPSPFGESPLLPLVDAILPSVDAQDPDSGAMIRALLERVRESRNPGERRELGLSLEWFYLYFTRQTELSFELWVRRRTAEHQA